MGRDGKHSAQSGASGGNGAGKDCDDGAHLGLIGFDGPSADDRPENPPGAGSPTEADATGKTTKIVHRRKEMSPLAGARIEGERLSTLQDGQEPNSSLQDGSPNMGSLPQIPLSPFPGLSKVWSAMDPKSITSGGSYAMVMVTDPPFGLSSV